MLSCGLNSSTSLEAEMRKMVFNNCECAQEEAPNAVEAVTHPEGEAEASHPILDSEAPTV